MPRKESPIDPAVGPLTAFAHDLRLLRKQAGHPTYRALARRTGFSATTLSAAASGTRLPTLDVTLAYVQACGGDSEAWRERWYELDARLAGVEPIADAIPEGYPGSTAGRTPTAGPGSMEGSRRRLAQRTRFPVLTSLGWPLGLALSILVSIVLLIMLVNRPPVQSPKTGVSLMPIPSPVGTGASAVPPQQGRCTDVAATRELGTPQAPFQQSTGAADAQRLPGQISRLVPAYGDLVRNPRAGSDTTLLDELGANFTDGVSVEYTDTGATDGQQSFVSVDLATPKSGLCFELLAYDGLSLIGGGGDVGLIHAVTTGPHLTAAHAVLECGSGGGLTTLSTCAWAGPVNGAGTPFFGEFWIFPDIHNTALVNMTAVQTATFADTLFAAMRQAAS